METNQELRNAWDFVEHTGISIFLTGKAGTGKTTFLRHLRRQSAKTMVVVAPTGVAAVNAEGVTIHSFFQLPLSPYVPGSEMRDKYGFSKEKLKIIRALDLLVIDEISMVRSDQLDAIDASLRKYRRNGRPFGGVQLLMIGDLQQLAPVVTPADEAVLRPYYNTPYFFGSRALGAVPYVTIQLTRVFRQQDGSFVELLNHVRRGVLTTADRAMLDARVDTGFRPALDSDYIRLTTHNHMADSYNDLALMKLPGNSRAYEAEVSGTFPESSFPTAGRLILKTGAQVMFIKNDPDGNRFYNGLIGHVVALGADSVQVACPGHDGPIDVVAQTWENAKYTVNPETLTVETTVQGRFSQLPLRLAWAVTIHKSQGLTFDHVVIDAGASFAPGQVYVALSRCRTLDGIVLATPISDQSILNDAQVTEYIAGQDAAATESLDRLSAIKEDYRMQLLREMFGFVGLDRLQESLKRLFQQNLSKSFPSATSTQVEVSDNLRTQVIEVADKWLALLASLTPEATRQDAFLERVKGGCRYFSETLRKLIPDGVSIASRVKVGDKKLMQRLQTLLTDLHQAYSARVRLLDAMALHGFTISNYLNCKQQATLGAGEQPAKAKRKTASADAGAEGAAKPRQKKKKEPRPKPAPSRELSLKMLREGMTRHEIAQERNLALSTITSHLQSYVADGELDIEDIYGTALVNAMESALDRVGRDEGLEPMISALKDTGLTPYDIRFFLSRRL